MTSGKNAAVPRIAVYGSCVSRDAVEHLGQGRFELPKYVARQSLISVGRDGSDLLPEELGLKHAFQERMVRGDWAGDLWEQLESAGEFDILLWDLIDERHGVCVLPNGDVVTRSVDSMSSKAVQERMDQGEKIPFGSSVHFDAWTAAADEFARELRTRDLWDKVVVIQVPWAVRSRGGEGVPASMGITAGEANKKFVPYYYHLESLGFSILKVECEVLGDPEHQWGLAPFHYVPEVYNEIDKGIFRRLSALEYRRTYKVSKS